MVLSLVMELAYLLVLAIAADLLRRAIPNLHLVVADHPATMAAAVILSYAAVMMPVTFYRVWVLPRRAGRPVSSAWAALVRLGIRLLARGVYAFVLLAAGTCLMYALIGHAWPLVPLAMVGLWSLGDRLLSRPVRPPKDRPLPDVFHLLRRFADESGFREIHLRVVDAGSFASGQTAWFEYLSEGPTICLNCEALQRLTLAEARVAVAHELSHYAHDDNRRSRNAGRFMWWVALLFVWPMLPLLVPPGAGPGAALLAAPLLAVVWWLAAMVLSVAVGARFRRTEKRAYAEALKMTADPEAYRSLVHRLASQGALLRELRPFHKLMGISHPSAQELLKLVDEYENANNPADVI